MVLATSLDNVSKLSSMVLFALFLSNPTSADIGDHVFADWSSTSLFELSDGVSGAVSRTTVGAAPSNNREITTFGADFALTEADGYLDPTTITSTTEYYKDILGFIDFGFPVQKHDNIQYVITFSSSVTDPRLHFYNLDEAKVTISGVSTVTRLSGNSEFDVVGSVVNSVGAIPDWSGCKQDDNSHPNGACGSVELTGSIASVTLTVEHSQSTVLSYGDGFGWTISFQDSELPSVLIQDAPASVNSLDPFNVTFEFSENVTGFEIGDISVANASLSNFVTVDSTTYTADIVPNGDGNITIDVSSDVAADVSGGGNLAATQVIVSYGATATTIVAIQIANVSVDRVLARLNTVSMSASQLQSILSSWDKQGNGNIAYGTREDMLGTLRDYLDPDGNGTVVELRWQTVDEIGTVGFYAERKKTKQGKWQRINETLLPGLIDAPLGGEYMLFDPGAETATPYLYRLIEQEVWGSRKAYGPYSLENLQ